MIYKTSINFNNDIVISDPALDNTAGTCLYSEIFKIPIAENRRVFMSIPKGLYNVEIENDSLNIIIINKHAPANLKKTDAAYVPTTFSSSVAVVEIPFYGDSTQFSDFNPTHIQFKAEDMLKLIKKHNIKTSKNEIFKLHKCIKDGIYFPTANILDSSLLQLIDNIPNTIWSNQVMLMAHGSNGFVKIPYGIAFKAPTPYCMCYKLTANNVTYGMYIDLCIKPEQITFIKEPEKILYFKNR